MRHALAVAAAVVIGASYFVLACRAYRHGSDLKLLAYFTVGAMASGILTAGTWHLLGVWGA